MDGLDLPSTMRAWSYTKRGRPRDVLKLDRSRSLPQLAKQNQILVQVHYVGMNPSFADIVMRLPNPRGRESVAELEYSGVIIAAGPGTDARFTKGQAVFGAVDDKKLILFGMGVMQDYVLLDIDEVYLVPEGFSMAEAAGLTCAGQTALNMVQTTGVVKGSRVFVNGASGGVGMFCVQICKAIGAYVIASCSEQSRQLVESLGPDEIVDYQLNSPLANYFTREYQNKPFDFILDTIGVQELYTHSPSYLKADGIYANAGAYEGIGNTIWAIIKNYCWPSFLGGTPRKWIMIRTPLDRMKMERLLQFAEAGQIKVPIDSVWDVNKGDEEIYKAYDRVLSKRAKGKVIVKLAEE